MQIGGFENIIPLEDRVIIKPAEEEEVTSSGIIIPESTTEGAVRGTVMAVGPGKYSENGTVIPITVKVGDEVLYGTKYFGTECIFDGEKVLVIPHTNIFAILKRKVQE
jgi:chaperonin GroES